jgi:hypothetical protein
MSDTIEYPYPKHDSSKSDQEQGIYGRYLISRTDKWNAQNKHFACEYFVLDWNHDKFTIPAMKAYAEACKSEFPALAEDILKLIKKHEQEKETRT